MDPRGRGHARGVRASRRRNPTQTSILAKASKRRVTRSKSRAATRPALKSKGPVAKPAVARKSKTKVGVTPSAVRAGAQPARADALKSFFKHFHDLAVPATVVISALALLLVFSVQEVLGFYDGRALPLAMDMASVAESKRSEVETEAAVGLPARLRIQKIGVDAAIRPVGVSPDGSMGTPKRPRDVAWYMYGPKPGEKGSAVIAGHLNWWYGAIGAFERLKDLEPGDRIAVQDESGAFTNFVVRETRTFGKNEDASEVFISNDGKSHLNLVTCSGIWNRLAKQYAKRLVVFADKE